jgi:thiol-disulfide isomerase/thioredoxin
MTPQNEIPLDEVSGVEERPQNRREWSGPLRSIVLPILLVMTIVGVLIYIERARDGAGGDSSIYGTIPLEPGLNPTGDAPSTEIGSPAPDFLLQTPDGDQLRLSELRGTPVLVNFWASWCTPCREEMPRIVHAHGSAGGGFAVVAVNLQENDGIVAAFADDFGMQFPIVMDRNGEVGQTWRIGGPVEGIPSSYFIDASGVVQARVFGPLSDDVLRANVDAMID